MTTCNVFKVENLGKGIGIHPHGRKKPLAKAGQARRHRGRLKNDLFFCLGALLLCTIQYREGGEEPMEIAGVSRDAEA